MIGTTMASTEAVKYPPIMSECPDYYRKEATGCVSKISDITNLDACKSVDFNDTTVFTNNGNSGMGPDSAICEKKNWAINCGVNWDGITNNDNICYA